MANQSISFDRAADFYDETRSFPPGISAQIADITARLIPIGRPVLEIGIGTGRISKPLLERGLQITGVDLSSKMIAHFLEKLSPNTPRPRLALADAARLPFGAGGFTAVLAVHVFHLIAPWREALSEAHRVLEPSGILLSGYDWRPPESPFSRLRDKWREILQAYDRQRPGPRDFDEVKQILADSGARMDEVEAAQWTRNIHLGEYIQALESGIYSSTWLLEPDELAQAAADLRRWARAEYGTLDRELSVPQKFIWQRFQW